MFRGGGDQGGALRRFCGVGQQAAQGQVVGLGAAGGEEDLALGDTEGAGNTLPGVVEGGPRGAARAVDAGGIPGQGVEGLDQGGAHRGPQGAGGVVVEVDAHQAWVPGAVDSSGPRPSWSRPDRS
jgi:hypothetical protein